MQLASTYFPRAVIVDRSAVLGRPADDGSLFLDAGPEQKSPRTVTLPGLTLKARRGPGPLSDDMPFGDLFRSGQPRTALENMKPSRARSGVPRTLRHDEMESWLERIARNKGEDELVRIRREADELAPQLGLADEAGRLGALISSLLGTGEAPLKTDAGRARARGTAFDTDRIALFELLHRSLSDDSDMALRSPVPDPKRAMAFFEAYFSNFIEGTEFDIETAEEIVFKGLIPPERPADAHDIRGTFKVVSDPRLRSLVPQDAHGFLSLLQELNRTILEKRPETRPGEWKELPNRAGNTTFVAPELVQGTLREAWRFYSTLPGGLPRATFAMFVVTEVHPFADGNGRVARALLNSELTAAGQCRVLIPLSYRSDYLGVLRALSRQRNPEPLKKMIERTQRWSALIDWSTIETSIEQLSRTNALVPSDEAEADGIILLDPEDARARSGSARADLG